MSSCVLFVKPGLLDSIMKQIAFYTFVTIILSGIWRDVSASEINIVPDTNLCRQYIRSGYAKMSIDSVDRAIEDYTKAILYNPAGWLAYQYRGYAYKAAKKYTEALADFSKALLINSKDIRSYRGRGDSKQLIGEYDNAIKDYNAALYYSLPDTSYEALIGRAFSYYKLKKYTESVRDYNIIIRRFGEKYPPAYFKRGMAYMESGNYDKAELDFSTYLAINGTEPFAAYYQRGISNLRQFKPDNAIYDFKLYLKSQAPDPLLYHYMALAHALKKDSVNAREYYKRSIESDLGGNVSYIYSEWARVEYDWGHYNFSADLSRKSILNAKKMKESIDPLWYYTFSLALIKIQDTTLALECMKSALAINNEYYNIYEERAKLLASKVTASHEVIQDLTKMIILVEGNEDKARLYAACALIKKNAKDFIGAQEDIHRAIEFNPNNAFYYIDQIRYYILRKGKKYSEEDKSFLLDNANEAIRINSRLGQAYLTKSILLSFFGDKKQACENNQSANTYGIALEESIKIDLCTVRLNNKKMNMLFNEFLSQPFEQLLPYNPVLK